MPFLHGFRRIIFEYQPLVDEILAVIGIQDNEQAGVTPDTSSYLARHSDKFAALNELLEKHVNSSYYKDGISYSLLKVAEQGMVPAAQILLHYGADLSFEDPVTYYTPLHIAVLRSQPDMVELLVRSGADINKRDRIHESSPLDLASEEQERLPCLQRLLQMGADVNAADKHGKTPLLHAMASMDGVQIHNTENIRLLLEGGANVKATMKDGDTAFSSLIFLLGEAVGSEEDEAKLINRFCFQVSQLLVAHGADPSECPSYESLTHACFMSFKLQYPLLRFLLESGASYHCSQHGPSCWSGISILFDRLCDYLGCCKDPDSLKLITMAESLLDLMIAQSPRISLPRNYELNTAPCPAHADRVTALYQYLKQLGQAPPTLKHLCRVFIRQRLRPWPVDEKLKSLPLPDRMKLYLLIHPNVPCEENL